MKEQMQQLLDKKDYLAAEELIVDACKKKIIERSGMDLDYRENTLENLSNVLPEKNAWAIIKPTLLLEQRELNEEYIQRLMYFYDALPQYERKEYVDASIIDDIFESIYRNEIGM